MSLTFDITDTSQRFLSVFFLFIYSIYHTVAVFALQLIYIFVVLFRPHVHEYVSFIFFFSSLVSRVGLSHRCRAASEASANKIQTS